MVPEQFLFVTLLGKVFVALSDPAEVMLSYGSNWIRMDLQLF